MRKCIRCGAEMTEECAVRQSDNACGLVVAESNRLFAKNIGKLQAAVCLECGEVSLYIDGKEMEKYRERKKA